MIKKTNTRKCCCSILFGLVAIAFLITALAVEGDLVFWPIGVFFLFCLIGCGTAYINFVTQYCKAFPRATLKDYRIPRMIKGYPHINFWAFCALQWILVAICGAVVMHCFGMAFYF